MFRSPPGATLFLAETAPLPDWSAIFFGGNCTFPFADHTFRGHHHTFHPPEPQLSMKRVRNPVKSMVGHVKSIVSAVKITGNPVNKTGSIFVPTLPDCASQEPKREIAGFFISWRPGTGLSAVGCVEPMGSEAHRVGIKRLKRFQAVGGLVPSLLVFGIRGSW